jgi:hypothetical protein
MVRPVRLDATERGEVRGGGWWWWWVVVRVGGWVAVVVAVVVAVEREARSRSKLDPKRHSGAYGCTLCHI